MSPTLFVTGATGNQGTNLVKGLLSINPEVTIHALVRNPDSVASQALTALSSNVKLFKGDFDDIPAIHAAVSGCNAAFLNVTPVFTDPSGESRHAKNLISACSSTLSLTRLIFSSSSAMELPFTSPAWTDFIPTHPHSWNTRYMTSKRACEEAVLNTPSTSFPEGWFIIRGTTFFTNFLSPFSEFMYPDLRTNQTLTTALHPDLLIPYLDPSDLSTFAARALLSPPDHWAQHYKNRSLFLGKQNLTLSQVIEAMNHALKTAGSSKQIEVIQIPREEAEKRAAKGDLICDTQMFQNEYYVVDDLRKKAEEFGVGVDRMVGVEEFFERERDRVVDAVGGR